MVCVAPRQQQVLQAVVCKHKSNDTMEDLDVAVVGGGPAGLAVANAVLRALPGTKVKVICVVLAYMFRLRELIAMSRKAVCTCQRCQAGKSAIVRCVST